MDKKTIDAYNQLAHKYDEETRDFWDQFPRTFLDTFITLSGENILDVGSGPGRDGLLLQKSGKNVTCVDASQAMMKLTAARGLHSVLADFDPLPFEDEFFDGVWAYTSLLHVPRDSIDKALFEIRRVLKPQGVFALGLIEGDSEEYRVTAKVEMPRLFSYYQKAEIEQLCLACGFRREYFESFKPGTRNYLNFIFRRRNNV
jgi:ubiquinone/menaquinone biosynthesis C-methylase UbiE